jgi:sec-independent protein translocase protein TatB
VDLGFLEIILVMIVGLVVIGPERMPEVARSIMYWWGRLKNMLSDTRAELEKEIGADDIRRQLKNETIMKQLGESKEAIQSAVNETTENIQRFKHIGESKARSMTLPGDDELIRQKKLALKAEQDKAKTEIPQTGAAHQTAVSKNNKPNQHIDETGQSDEANVPTDEEPKP